MDKQNISIFISTETKKQVDHWVSVQNLLSEHGNIWNRSNAIENFVKEGLDREKEKE